MNRTSYNCSYDNLNAEGKKNTIYSLLSSSTEVDLLPSFDLEGIDFKRIKVVSYKDIYDLNLESEGYIFLLRGGKSGINGYHKSIKAIVMRTLAFITYYEKEDWKLIVMD